jgi:hypothetical protein
MLANDNIIKKQEKIKCFSKYLYRALNREPASLIISDDTLHDDGTTKKDILNDCRKIIKCSKIVNYKTATVKKTFNPQYTPQPAELPAPVIEKKEQNFSTNYCNIPLICHTCAEKGARRKWTLLEPQIKKLILKYPYVYFITFTTRDNPDLNQNYNTLNESLRKFYLMGQTRTTGKRSGGEAAKIKASTIAKEIKKGKNSKNYHIHAHTIAFCNDKLDYSVYDKKQKEKIILEYRQAHDNRNPPKELLNIAWKDTGEIVDHDTGEIKEIPFSKLTREWYEVTNGEGINLDIKPLLMPTMRRKVTQEDLFNTIREAIKYTCKVSDFTREEIIEILSNRKDKRFFSTTGELYDQQTEEQFISEEIEIDRLFGYAWNPVSKKMEKLNKRHEAFLYDMIERAAVYKEYKSKVMQAYSKKDSIKKYIMKSYLEMITEPQHAENKNLKLSVISALDKLTDTYNAIKRTLYKTIILTADNGSDTRTINDLQLSQEIKGMMKTPERYQNAAQYANTIKG